MSVWGKIIGGAAGFALGGPLGALLGAVAGHVYDTHRGTAVEETGGDPTRQVGFTIAVIALGAKLAKADGVVPPNHIRPFRPLLPVPPGAPKTAPPLLHPPPNTHTP